MKVYFLFKKKKKICFKPSTSTVLPIRAVSNVMGVVGVLEKKRWFLYVWQFAHIEKRASIPFLPFSFLCHFQSLSSTDILQLLFPIKYIRILFIIIFKENVELDDATMCKLWQMLKSNWYGIVHLGTNFANRYKG